jgi:hypothetical protein
MVVPFERTELDHFGAILLVLAHLLAHRPRTICNAAGDGAVFIGQEVVVAVPARDADRLAGRDDARPGHFAGIDGVLEVHVGKARPAEIAHGGEAGAQRLLGIRDARDGRARGRDSKTAIAVQVRAAGEVNVAVGETGQQEGAVHLDPRRAG